MIRGLSIVTPRHGLAMGFEARRSVVVYPKLACRQRANAGQLRI